MLLAQGRYQVVNLPVGPAKMLESGSGRFWGVETPRKEKQSSPTEGGEREHIPQGT